MSDDPCPCGPQCWRSKLPGWAHLPQFVFKDACREHDRLYTQGGTPADRKAADDRFLALMREAIAGRPWYSRAWLGLWAWAFHRAVRAEGWRYFNAASP